MRPNRETELTTCQPVVRIATRLPTGDEGVCPLQIAPLARLRRQRQIVHHAKGIRPKVPATEQAQIRQLVLS